MWPIEPVLRHPYRLIRSSRVHAMLLQVLGGLVEERGQDGRKVAGMDGVRCGIRRTVQRGDRRPYQVAQNLRKLRKTYTSTAGNGELSKTLREAGTLELRSASLKSG
jgi:hypothetical protein